MSLKHTLLVLGSQNSKVADQELSRDQIRPVQILQKDGDIKPVSFFNQWGKVGVSSMAWHPKFEHTLYVSINDELRVINTQSMAVKKIDLGVIGDLHDIEFLGYKLWISNTEYDEAICFDPTQQQVTQRISLSEYRTEKELVETTDQSKDRFHCNQVFRNYEGDLCVLIHHITGWQYFRTVMETLIRRQGDGGIINLDKKKILKLKLQSPHSVRLINNEYWVQDSTDQSTKIYDREWRLIHTIPIGGFGRGVAFSEEHNVAYIAISATRKRYLRVIPTGGKHDNRIMLVDIKTRKEIETISIPNIEQLDNIYILDGQLKQLIDQIEAP
jgi:hypothetical protein